MSALSFSALVQRQALPLVFADTGLEFPEIKSFVASVSGVVVVRPEKSFREVVSEHMQRGENRIQRLGRTHPKLHRYCLDEVGLRGVLSYLKQPTCPTDGSCGCDERLSREEERG